MSEESEQERQLRIKLVTARLAGDFEDLTPKEIDTVVAGAKEGAHRNTLENFFDGLMIVLETRDCPVAIIEMFRSKRGPALAKLQKIWDGRYPNDTLESLRERGIRLIVPVIPYSCLDAHRLMAMIHYGGKVGCIDFDPSRIRDREIAPEQPYFIYDVADGRDNCGKTQEYVLQTIKERSRVALNSHEAIALAFHAGVLKHHNLLIAGSNYQDSGQMLYIAIEYADVPVFGHVKSVKSATFGIPSCSSREE